MNVGTLLQRASLGGLYRTVVALGPWSDEEQSAAERAMEEHGWPVAADASYNRVVITRSARGYQAKRETWDGWAGPAGSIDGAIGALMPTSGLMTEDESRRQRDEDRMGATDDVGQIRRF